MKSYINHGDFILGQTAWEEGRPWLRPAAASYIEKHLPNHPNVFEWGSGASTIWLARMGCDVVSCENDHDWCKTVRERILSERLDLHNIETHDFSHTHDNLQRYADKILEYNDGSFDLVIVDGRNRVRCLSNALSKVKIGGMLCLDNSERSEYAEAVALMDTWEGLEWGDEGWMTAVWYRSVYSNTTRVVFPNRDA